MTTQLFELERDDFSGHLVGLFKLKLLTSVLTKDWLRVFGCQDGILLFNDVPVPDALARHGTITLEGDEDLAARSPAEVYDSVRLVLSDVFHDETLELVMHDLVDVSTLSLGVHVDT